MKLKQLKKFIIKAFEIQLSPLNILFTGTDCQSQWLDGIFNVSRTDFMKAAAARAA